MNSLIVAGIAAFFEKLFAAIFGSRQETAVRTETNETHERIGATEASNETAQVIAETAAARADLPPEPDSPDALVAELRDRAARKRALNGSRDPAQSDSGGKTGNR